MKTILVTGGAGFIGSHVCDLLFKKGHNVIVYDDLSHAEFGNLQVPKDPKRLMFHHGSVLDEDKLREVIESHNIDSIIHLAAVASVPDCEDNPRHCFAVNVAGTSAILGAAKTLGVSITFASSAAVYADMNVLRISENHELLPESQYGMSKLIGEKLIESYRTSYGVSSCVFRFFNVFGPRQKGGVVAKFLKCAKEKKRLVMHGDGNQTRDFIFVGDIARMLVQATLNNQTGTYNLCSGKGTKIKDLARMIQPKGRVIYVEQEGFEIQKSVGNPLRAERRLDFHCEVKLDNWIKGEL